MTSTVPSKFGHALLASAFFYSFYRCLVLVLQLTHSDLGEGPHLFTKPLIVKCWEIKLLTFTEPWLAALNASQLRKMLLFPFYR